MTYPGGTIVCLELCITSSQSIERVSLSIASISCNIRHSILSVHYEKQYKHVHIALISAYKQTIIIINLVLLQYYEHVVSSEILKGVA